MFVVFILQIYCAVQYVIRQNFVFQEVYSVLYTACKKLQNLCLCTNPCVYSSKKEKYEMPCTVYETPKLTLIYPIHLECAKQLNIHCNITIYP